MHATERDPGAAVGSVDRLPLLLLRLAAATVLLAVVTDTQADPDLWGHVRFGQDIVSRRAVPAVDPYAFTSDRPWVNHEWLAEVAMYGAYATGGQNGLIGLKVATVLAVAGLVAWSLRHHALPTLVHDFLIGLTLLGTRARTYTVRPQIFSVLFFTVLLLLLIEADRGRRKALALAPPLMLLWINVHGGWIVGAGILGLWAVFDVASPHRSWRERVEVAVTLLASLLVTLVNAYGTGMWRFLWQTVRFSRLDISDWQPATTLSVGALIPWVVTFALMILVLARTAWPRLSYVAMIAFLGVASLKVSRLDAFFSLSVILLLAPVIARAWGHAGGRPDQSAGKPHSWIAVAVIVVGAACGIVVAGVSTVQGLGCIRMPDRWPPETEATRFIQLNRLEGRMLTYFDWGQYAIWHFAPALQVSMDGRRETVYSDRQIWSHVRFYLNLPSAQDYARALNPNYIWLPKKLPVIETLDRQGWVRIFDGRISVIFAKSPEREFAQPPGASHELRCFPGP